MILYVLRHAIAFDRTKWRKADSERPLTEDGIRRMKKAAKGMKEAGFAFDHLLTSPYRRAYDTAAIVADVFDGVKIRVSRALASDGDPKALVRHLALDFRNSETVLLVGHEPYLSKLISVLITGQEGAALDLKKGGLCRLQAPALTYGKCATLEAWYPPKSLRKLA